MQERSMKHELGEDFVRVGEAAAIAAARTRGRGDRHASDLAAVEAMQRVIKTVPMKGRIRISEGERDGAPMLPIGARVGLGWQYPEGNGRYPVVDIAVDSLEGTNLCALGKENAVAIMACTEEDGMKEGPDGYMDKIGVGPAARDLVSLDFPIEENLEIIANSLDRDVPDLNILCLDRERNQELIDRIRRAGASVRLISDGDLAMGIFVAMGGSNLHAVVGIGASPETHILAASLKILGGGIQAKYISRADLPQEDQKKLNPDYDNRLKNMGLEIGRIYDANEMVPGSQIVVAATAVTRWGALEEVKFFTGGTSCRSIVMSTDPGIGRQIREIKTTYLEDDPDLVYRLS